MPRVVPVLVLLPAALALSVGWTRKAHAVAPDRTRLSLDLDYVVAIDEDAIDGGSGGAFRLGRELDAVELSLTPELSAGFHSFSGDLGPKLYRATAGARLNFGKLLEPGVFGHAGIGHASYDAPAGAADPSRTAFTWDAGLTLDVTALPVIELGAHAAFDSLSSGDAERALQWITLGIHASLAL